MRVLFVGDCWQGSNARSLREALARRGDLLVADVNFDNYMPQALRSPLMRITNRLSGPIQRRELEEAIVRACDDFAPDCVIFYKGWNFGAGFLDRVAERGIARVNCFPDYSPHAYGPTLTAAMGRFDLVISAKPFHPPLWESVYGYSNTCVFTPHGYDPNLHLRKTPPERFDFDLILVATGRPEYFELTDALAAALKGRDLKVVIGGHGWEKVATDLPDGWRAVGVKPGLPYADWLRRAKIAIAPVQRRVVVNGVVQPGDEDTARTYELAAAHCFFIHRRTAVVETLYDEASEVPLWDTPQDLADKIVHYLDHDDERAAMAARAHARAVPAYSTDARAEEIVGHLRAMLAKRPGGRA